MKKKEKIIIYIFIIILLLIDQITKIIAIKNGYIIQNTNINSNGYYIFINIIIVLMIIRYIINNNLYIKMQTRIILSFAIAGGIGNLIDRVWNKSVIVFINLNNHLELNLSYIYIFISWIGMAIILTINTTKFLKNKRKIENENNNQ